MSSLEIYVSRLEIVNGFDSLGAFWGDSIVWECFVKENNKYVTGQFIRAKNERIAKQLAFDLAKNYVALKQQRAPQRFCAKKNKYIPEFIWTRRFFPPHELNRALTFLR